MDINTTIIKGEKGDIQLVDGGRNGLQLIVDGDAKHVPAYMAEYAKTSIIKGGRAYDVWRAVHRAIATGDIQGTLR